MSKHLGELDYCDDPDELIVEKQQPVVPEIGDGPSKGSKIGKSKIADYSEFIITPRSTRAETKQHESVRNEPKGSAVWSLHYARYLSSAYSSDLDRGFRHGSDQQAGVFPDTKGGAAGAGSNPIRESGGHGDDWAKRPAFDRVVRLIDSRVAESC